MTPNKIAKSMNLTIFQQLWTNWHPMRWVALGISLLLGYNWIVNNAPISGMLSLFFLFQAVTNTGCIAGRCAVPTHKDNVSNSEEIVFVEINNK